MNPQLPYEQLVSVIIPLYNEAENIENLLHEVHFALQGWRYELILVDDGSTDATFDKLRQHKSDKDVVLQLRQNYGQALAISAGIHEAKGEAIATLDGDLQNHPADLTRLFKYLWEKDLDFVTGIRQNRQDAIGKTLPSKIANSWIRSATGLNISDHGCGIKAMTASTAKSLNLYADSHRYIALIAHLKGARVGEIPVEHSARIHGKSKYGLERTFKVISDLALILFRRKFFLRPIHFFGNLGILSFMLGVVLCLYLVVIKLITGADIGSRPLLFLGILLILVGIQFFSTGVLLDLGMRTYYESQDKKPFVIRQKLES